VLRNKPSKCNTSVTRSPSGVHLADQYHFWHMMAVWLAHIVNFAKFGSPHRKSKSRTYNYASINVQRVIQYAHNVVYRPLRKDKWQRFWQGTTESQRRSPRQLWSTINNQLGRGRETPDRQRPSSLYLSQRI
jgi:hypothetical protein